MEIPSETKRRATARGLHGATTICYAAAISRPRITKIDFRTSSFKYRFLLSRVIFGTSLVTDVCTFPCVREDGENVSTVLVSSFSLISYIEPIVARERVTTE